VLTFFQVYDLTLSFLQRSFLCLFSPPVNLQALILWLLCSTLSLHFEDSRSPEAWEIVFVHIARFYHAACPARAPPPPPPTAFPTPSPIFRVNRFLCGACSVWLIFSCRAIAWQKFTHYHLREVLYGMLGVLGHMRCTCSGGQCLWWLNGRFATRARVTGCLGKLLMGITNVGNCSRGELPKFGQLMENVSIMSVDDFLILCK